MTNIEMLERLDNLEELENLIECAKTEADAIKKEIQEEMEDREVESVDLGRKIVRWTSILTTRFDTKTFKEKFGEEFYKLYTKEVPSKRWSVA